MKARPTVLEFFAGGGMARTGLGAGWECTFANDLSPQKAAAYRLNWGGDHLHVGDVAALSPADLPGRPDLAWASSPCQDLSLAGGRAGLGGARSGAFWGFHALMAGPAAQGRAPRVIVAENVAGLLSSGGGADFTALCAALVELGYRFGALEIDASHFVPQSRPRLFVVAVRGEVAPRLAAPAPSPPFHPRRLIEADARLPPSLRARRLWWRLPAPPTRNTVLADLLEPDAAVAWDEPVRTARLLSLLGPLHRQRLEAARASGGREVAALFRRTRVEGGERVQRAELRFDGLAGCLRTPRGGSSRQFILAAQAGEVRTRALTPREAARLMGLPDDWRLPPTATAALQLAGDGVAAPVVRWLAAHLLEPLVGLETRAAA